MIGEEVSFRYHVLHLFICNFQGMLAFAEGLSNLILP